MGVEGKVKLVLSQFYQDVNLLNSGLLIVSVGTIIYICNQLKVLSCKQFYWIILNFYLKKYNSNYDTLVFCRYVRCYTENCDMLFEEQFNAENIVTITSKCQKSAKHSIPRPEEIYIQYQSVVCIINGQQLISILKNCHNDTPPTNQDLASLMPKKWGFQEQSLINDSAVVGLNVANTFDHLLIASTCGGFYTKYRAMPPNNTLVIAAGSKPFLGYHYALEGGGQPVLSDVAKAVASKLKSTLP